MADRAFLQQLMKRLADDGKIIESGWVSLRLVAIPLDAPAIQLSEMRKAYMAGAQHLFASIMSFLDDDDDDPTPDDLRRMDLISKELEEYQRELELDLARGPPKGSA